jgi:hypothetical protein
MNDFAVATALATSPSAAFAELRERPRFWFPLLAIAISTAVMIAWYYSVVDIDWLKEQIFGSNPDMQKMPAEARAAAMNFMGRKTMLISGIFGAVMVIPFFFLLTALYFLLAAKITKMPLGLKHWFSLVCWCSLPILINVAAGAVVLLLRDNDQIIPGVLQPLSLNELVFHRPMGARGQALLDSFNIAGVLSSILMVIGVHAWSQRSWLFSSIVALLPTVLIYGIWAFFAFRN